MKCTVMMEASLSISIHSSTFKPRAVKNSVQILINEISFEVLIHLFIFYRCEELIRRGLNKNTFSICLPKSLEDNPHIFTNGVIAH